MHSRMLGIHCTSLLVHLVGYTIFVNKSSTSVNVSYFRDLTYCGGYLISLSLGDQITTTLATSVLPVCSEENS